MCITLNEGYLRSANKQIFNQDITDQPSMKRQIFLVCLFYCFFRLPIYESIAAIFWQSASYVFFIFWFVISAVSDCLLYIKHFLIFVKFSALFHVFKLKQ